ncbi:MAG TPA: cupin domain-containing protein [Acidimicrobiia bacterium]
MTVVRPAEITYRQLPGRRSADPFTAAAAAGGESVVRQVTIEPGVRRTPHRHPHSEEVTYVVSGRGKLWLDGTYHTVEAGTWVRVPAGVPHATLADPGDQLLLVCFFPYPTFEDNIEELDTILVTPDQEEPDG